MSVPNGLVLADSAAPFSQFINQGKQNVESSGSSNSSPQTGDVEPESAKRKRKQYQACDACRLRRVKCERDSENEPCKGCLRRGFDCRRDYNETKAKANRGSKRLLQAEAMFGLRTPIVDSRRPSSSSIPTSSAQTPDPLAVLPQDVTLFTWDSAEARLASIQNSEFSTNALIHGYRDTLIRQNVLQEDFTGFLERFEGAGRRFHELTAADKTTASIVMALAARVSDLPVVAGAKAAMLRPKVLQMRDANSASFSAIGAERDAICRRLEQRARSCVEQSFFFRQEASMDAIAGLLAIQSIQDVDDPHNWKHGVRIYSAAAVEQLRSIASKMERSPAEERFLQSPAVRGLFITDSMWSFASGRPSQLTDDDVLLLRPQLLNLPPVEAIRAACTPPSISTLYMLTWWMMSLGRTLHRQFSSAVARMRQAWPLPSFYEQTLNNLVGLLEVTSILEHGNFLDFYGLQPLRACQLGFVCELAYLQHTCHRAATRKGGDEAVTAQYGEILSRLNFLLLDAVLDLSDTAGKLAGSGMLMGNGLLWSGLRDMLRLFFELPTVSEGGPPHFTLLRKVDGCDNFVRCLRELAWSWPSDQLSDFESRLEGLRAQLFLETGSRGSDDIPVMTVPTSQSNDLDWLLNGTATLDNSIDILSILSPTGA